MSRLHRTIPIALALSFVGHAALLAALAWPEGEPGGSGDGALGSDRSPGNETPGAAAAGAGAFVEWTVTLVDGSPLGGAPSTHGVRDASGSAPGAASAPAPAHTTNDSNIPAPARTTNDSNIPAPARTTNDSSIPAPARTTRTASTAPSRPRTPADAAASPTEPRTADDAGATADSGLAALRAGVGGDARGRARDAAGNGGRVASGGHGPPGRWPGPGEVDRAARPRRPIRPRYPLRARRRGEESTVLIQAWVDESGDVSFSSVLESGGDDFDDSARVAVHDSSFEPALLGGQSVASRVALRIHFDLRD